MGHAVLSPSGASRWLACTPSARYEQQFPDRAGEAAKEGTLAHELAENLLRVELGLDGEPDGIAQMTINEIRKGLVKNESGGTYYNREMEDAVGLYVDYVLERVTEMRRLDPNTEVFLEEKISLEQWLPEGFGTRDFAAVGAGKVLVIDLKYGKGVPVSAERNKQLMLYAQGTVDELSILYSIDTVEMVIVQPRLDSISSYTLSAAELETWAREEVKPKALMAFNGEGEFVPGNHCGFCRAKADCKARMRYVFEQDIIRELDHNKLTDADIVEVLRRGSDIKAFISDIGERAFNDALAGKKWEGFKLVEGRSNRKVTDETALTFRLQQRGFKPAEFMTEPKLKGLGDLEKLTGKKVFTEVSDGLLDKPAGKPTLVPADDKRPEYSSVSNDFAGLDDSDLAPEAATVIPVATGFLKPTASDDFANLSDDDLLGGGSEPAKPKRTRKTKPEPKVEPVAEVAPAMEMSEQGGPQMYWAQHCYNNPPEYQAVQVEGTPIVIGIPGYEFFIHKAHDGSGRYSLSEVRSGCEIGLPENDIHALVKSRVPYLREKAHIMEQTVALQESRLKQLKLKAELRNKQ